MAPTEGDTQPTSLTDSSLSWSEADPLPADTPNADAPTASSPEAAIEPPVETPREGDGTGQHQGPIPFDRHKTILDGRTRERDEFKGKYESLTWAEQLTAQGYTQDQIAGAVQMANLAAGDVSGFLDYYRGVAETDPTAAAQLRSWAARVLGSGNVQPPPQGAGADQGPQPDLITEDGKHRVYSDRQQALREQWLEQKLVAKIGERYKPLTDLQGRVEKAEAEQRHFDQQYSSTKAEIAKLENKPHFKENIEGIRNYMREQNFRVSVTDAYLHILDTKVFPSISETERAKVVADYRQSAAASSASPNTASPSTPVRVTSLTDPSLKW